MFCPLTAGKTRGSERYPLSSKVRCPFEEAASRCGRAAPACNTLFHLREHPLVADADADRDEHADKRHAADHEIGAHVGARRVVERAGHGAAEGGEHQVRHHDGEVQRVVLQAIVRADERRVRGRHAAVGQTADDEARHQHREALHLQRRDQNDARHDEEDVHRLHRAAAADLVEQAAENHAADAVENRDQSNDGRDRADRDGRANLLGDGARL